MGKQHRERADMIVNTELAFAYNRGADIGIKRTIKNGYMGRCEMVWTTAGTNRVCGRCLALKDKVVGHTDEDGVTLPPLHPRCRCAIMYREVAEIKPRSNKPDKPQGTPKPPKQDGFVFDLQRFDAQPLPEGNYNLTVRRQVQNPTKLSILMAAFLEKVNRLISSTTKILSQGLSTSVRSLMKTAICILKFTRPITAMPKIIRTESTASMLTILLSNKAKNQKVMCAS